MTILRTKTNPAKQHPKVVMILIKTLQIIRLEEITTIEKHPLTQDQLIHKIGMTMMLFK